MTDKILIGVDEVGWGSIAGPMTVCACHVPPENYELLREKGFRDSKMVGNRLFTDPGSKRTEISSAKCIKLASWLDQACDELKTQNKPSLATWALSTATPQEIDRLTPAMIRHREWRTAVVRLITLNNWRVDKVKVIVDGNVEIKGLPDGVEQEAIPKADSTVLPVAVASVIAKADRDLVVLGMHHSYPAYGLDGHKGYGTEAHFEAILKHGPIVGLHRWSYLKTRVVNYFTKNPPEKKEDLPAWVREFLNT